MKKMFKLEKEMIPVLIKNLSEKYQTKLFIDEFDSGNGIADLVFATGISAQKQITPILDYKLMYIILNFLNRKNKKVELKEFYKHTFLTKKQLLKLINYLLELNILEKIDKEMFRVKNTYNPPIKKIVSIEAKLYDWKGGFYQALRYKAYSHKSYLAISQEFAHRVDINLFKQNNIGLIAVSQNRIHFLSRPKTENPNNKIANAYLSEKMINTFYTKTLNNHYSLI